MKLYKDGQNHWAARTHLDMVDDIDIQVTQYSCGRSVTTITIVFRDCPEGMITSFDYDGTRIYQYDAQHSFMGSDRLERGTTKLFSWTDKLALIRIGDFQQIPLEYEV